MKRFYLVKVYCSLGAMAFAAAIMAGSLQAAEPPASTTIDALVRDVLEKNPERRFYEAEIAAAKTGQKTAGVWSNPELNITAGHKSVGGAGGSGDGAAWSASVMQPFEWRGRIALRKAIANRDVELAELGYERFKLALTTRTRALAFAVLTAQEKEAAAEEVAGRFKALREVLVQRDPAGLTPLLETRVIEATELNAQRKASEAALKTKAALLELSQLRGNAAGESMVITLQEVAFQPVTQTEQFLQMARTNNFEIRVRAVELAQQGFRVDLAKNERYSAISAGPMYSEERAGGDRERVMGIGVTVPLPLWNKNKGNIESAQARLQQAEASFQSTRREVERNVAEAALIYNTKLEEMAKWKPDAVQHFRAAAELADRHYRLGAVPISTYVELQKQYLEAVEGLLDTKAEALKAAVELESLTGLTEPLVKLTSGEEAK